MPNLPIEALIVIAGIILATVLCVFYAVANAVRLESHIHDTKIKARHLRDVYAAEVAALQAEQALSHQVSIVGEGPKSMAA